MTRARLTLTDRVWIRWHSRRHGRYGGVNVTRWNSAAPYAATLRLSCACGRVRTR